MKLKRTAAKVTLIGAMSITAAGFGAGFAHADPPFPIPPPWPFPAPDVGPGANVGGPGNPFPPGQGYMPPPGHTGPTPKTRSSRLGSAGAAATVWAPWLPVVWNTELKAWGVWWNGSFQTL